ncbi:hypothetical protein I7I50_09967 [Histoplasma capsulatum G186AR]|uniref:Uncharacterized protein n=1 Tax=Ajellomyces capsulatus TaxID=5037 RepID=A0A8H8D631_AJECA|nr:hypothetical protein I7I52_01205 [Histoplasma capsulatum]QSS68858.1 hypothetical protein I7I50_09967 [Histoplasma capsulatum G186AR]
MEQTSVGRCMSCTALRTCPKLYPPLLMLPDHSGQPTPNTAVLGMVGAEMQVGNRHWNLSFCEQ